MRHELMILLRRFQRRMLLVRAAESAAVGATVGALLSAAGIVLSRVLLLEGAAWWFLLLIPLVAFAEIFIALIRGVSLRQTAAWLDARGMLAERLSTAVDLEQTGRGDSPVASAVDAQALAALQACDPAKLMLWRRMRATVAAMVLSLLLCGTLALLIIPSPVTHPPTMLDTLTADQREQLAAAFRAASADTTNEPAVAQKLADGARVIEIADDEQLQKIIKELKQADYEMTRVDPGDLLGGGRSADSTHAGAYKPLSPATIPAAPSDNTGPIVRVWDPGYTSPATTATASAGETADTYVSFDIAWAAARQRANRSADSGNIPPRYHRLVRDFFNEEN